MTEMPWGSPEALGKLTITQMLCVGHEKPPGTPKPIEDFESLEKELARIEKADRSAEAAWVA